jgi:hypothetical protein
MKALLYELPGTLQVQGKNRQFDFVPGKSRPGTIPKVQFKNISLSSLAGKQHDGSIELVFLELQFT